MRRSPGRRRHRLDGQGDPFRFDEELIEQARPRLHALMRGGCTTVEIKSGYGLDVPSEMRCSRRGGARRKRSGAGRADPARAARAAPRARDRREDYVGEIVDES
jgi:imidazolonepropionase